MAENNKKKEEGIIFRRLIKKSKEVTETYKKLDKQEERVVNALRKLAKEAKGTEDEKNFLRDTKEFVNPTLDSLSLPVTFGFLSLMAMIFIAQCSFYNPAFGLVSLGALGAIGLFFFVICFVSAFWGIADKNRDFKKAWLDAYREVYKDSHEYLEL